MLPHLLTIGVCLYLIISYLFYVYDCEAYEAKGDEVWIPITWGNVLHYLAWPYNVAIGR